MRLKNIAYILGSHKDPLEVKSHEFKMNATSTSVHFIIATFRCIDESLDRWRDEFVQGSNFAKNGMK